MNNTEDTKCIGEQGSADVILTPESVDVRVAGTDVEILVQTVEVEADGELLEQVEVEVHVRLPHERLPPAKRYIIKVDKDKLVTEHSHMTGRAILALASKSPPEKYKLTQLFCEGPPKTIGLDEDVDFCAPGVERFVTLKLEQTEGDAAARRDFELTSGDRKLLDSTGATWETLIEGGARWLLVRGFAIPEGYTVAEATVALQLPPGYPDAQIDMAYFNPPLTRADGKAIGALSPQAIAGQQFQRWSRHRTTDGQWRPELDDVTTHLVYVKSWLDSELVKG